MLGGALVSDAADALLAALALMQEHSVDEVLVEAVLPGARHFTCSVLSTDQVRTCCALMPSDQQAIYVACPVASTSAGQPGCPGTCRPPFSRPHSWCSSLHRTPCCVSHRLPPLLLFVQGTVALPPTELAVYDIEEAIADTELRLERFLAVREVGVLGCLAAACLPASVCR